MHNPRWCSYCENLSIGYEFDRCYGRVVERYVCADCSHENTTVHLNDGGVYVKRMYGPPRKGYPLSQNRTS